jgi:hypothetical protein
MVYKKSFAYHSARMYLYAGKMPRELAQGARQKEKPRLIERMRQAVVYQRVEALIKKKDLKKTFRRGVASFRGDYVLMEKNGNKNNLYGRQHSQYQKYLQQKGHDYLRFSNSATA